MRILFLYPGRLADPRRGTPLRSIHLARALKEVQEIHLLALDVPLDFQGCSTLLPRSIRGMNWYMRLRTVLRVCASFQPDIIYGQTHQSFFLLWVASLRGYVTCVDIHGDAVEERGLDPWKAWVIRRFHSFFLRRVRGATVVQSNLAARFPDDLSIQWHVLHGGVDMMRMDAVQPTTLSIDTPPLIAYCGNLRSYQGIEILFAALRTLHTLPWTFLFVCSSEEERARSLLAAFGIADRSILKSALPQNEVFALLKSADIAVVPRPDVPVTRIAFPSKLPEYLASGAAVIATDVGDARELVQEGRTGWLVRPGDSDDLARAIRETILHPQERAMRSARAVALMRKRYDWPRLVADLLSFFHTLVHADGDDTRHPGSLR